MFHILGFSLKTVIFMSLRVNQAQKYLEFKVRIFQHWLILNNLCTFVASHQRLSKTLEN